MLESTMGVRTSLENKAFKAVNSLFGGGLVMMTTQMTAKKRILGKDGLYHDAKHPNRLMAFLGFHDVRVVRNRVVTTAFVNDIMDCLTANATQLAKFDDYKYHDSGIGTGDEAVGDTALGTPWGGARSTGTQVDGGTTYTSVATTTYNASKAITEHGLFNESSGGVLMDRTKFDAINVVDTNQIQFTFVITFTAGG